MCRRPVLVVGLLVSLVAGSFFATTIVQGQAPPAIRADAFSFRDVVKSVLPAVVSVESKATPSNFRRFFEDLERRQAETPQTEQTIGFGSGFIVDAKGVILTNFHVVEGADTVEVTLADGRKFVSKDVKGDQRTDLAIVRIDPKGSRLPHLELGDSSQMEIGDRVLAV